MSIEASPDGPTPVYDVCVVGRGLMGSAAARHLAANGANVVAVGPPECNSSRKAEVEIFGAHYDEGRITRRTDPDPVWALLAQRSIGRSRKERRSLIRSAVASILKIRNRFKESIPHQILQQMCSE